MFLVDTNVMSELRKGQRAESNVVRWSTSYLEDTMYLSVITIMELEIGAQRIARRDAAQGALLRRWIEVRILADFSTRIIPVDLQTAKVSAGLHVPDPRPERDALIAATALVHGLTVVTRNADDFRPMGVRVFNPWTEQRR